MVQMVVTEATRPLVPGSPPMVAVVGSRVRLLLHQPQAVLEQGQEGLVLLASPAQRLRAAHQQPQPVLMAYPARVAVAATALLAVQQSMVVEVVAVPIQLLLVAQGAEASLQPVVAGVAVV